MNDTLHIGLLGGFRLYYGETPIRNLNTARTQSLLAFLALRAGTPQSRRRLASSFWPDSSDPQARTNLRQLLHHLRRGLPDPDRFLISDTETVVWNEEACYTLDVVEFVRTLDAWAANEAVDTRRSALEEAVRIYSGDLLPNCHDEWITPERERLRDRYATALERLVDLLEGERSYADALRYAQMRLHCDPLRETTYRTLMRLHALGNDRTSALRVYDECKTLISRELGVALDGKTQELYERLLHARTAADDSVPSSARPPTSDLRLIGRKREWTQLQAAWRDAQRQGARLVVIEGEAGIGKTRLADELMTWTLKQGMTAARTRCYAAEERLALGPVTEWLRSPPFIEEARKLADVWRSDLVPLLPELRVDDASLQASPALGDGWQRRRLFEAVARTVLAARRPIVLLIDDLQWCDRDTLEWLHFLLRFDPDAAVTVVGTIRMEELGSESALEDIRLALRRSAQVVEIALNPLTEAETRLLAEHVTGRTLDGNEAARIYQETEGNPLFIVESVRARMSSDGVGAGNSDDAGSRGIAAADGLSEKVHSVLSARLSLLSPSARRLAHVGAVIGRSFTLEMLGAASDHEEELFTQALDELWHRRIIRAYGPNVYDFSHEKLRDFTYADVTPARRLLLHRRVAEAFERLFSTEIDAFSGQIAAHYEDANMPEPAATYYERAAGVARRVQAFEEEIAHLNSALDLMRSIPQSTERDESETRLRSQLGAAAATA